MQSRLADMRARDTEILAISSDDEERAREIAEAYGIDFALLADPDLATIDAYGLRHESGGIGGDVARPATFILDRDGRIVWRDLTDNWRIRPRPEELLEVLDGLGRSASATTESETRPPLADVVSVAARGESGAIEFEVGIASPDTGCDQYADWWEVVDADGALLYRRILRHSHVDEQPFVRSGGPVDIDPERTVWVRAHMHPTGYGGRAMKGSAGAGFAAADPEPGFAAELENEPPLPEACAF